MEEFFTDFALPAAMWLTVLAAIAAIVLPLISLAGDPKSLIKTLAGIAFIAVVFFIGYAMADTDSAIAVRNGLDTGTVKMVGAMLNTFYILFILAIIAMVSSFAFKLVR